ncbi:MAG: glycosyltransferase family 2 protein [Patescibacteria group bacterium]
MNEKKISIIIPALNEERNIAACLRSLKQQDYQGEKEIIVVDNNSTDRTGAVAREEGALVLFEETRGVIPAREKGTLAATGDIIIQTDADTTFPTDWLSKIMKGFGDHDDVVAVIGSFHFFDGPWWGTPFTGLLFGVTNIIYKLTDRLIYMPGSNTAFKKEIWHGYNSKFDQGGDEIALLKELRKEGKIVFLRHNTVETSARRLSKGLLYNIFVILIFYNIIDYNFRRFFGRGLSSFPAIRQPHREEEKKVTEQTQS